MRANLIENGKVTNIMEVESLTTIPGLTLLDASLGGEVGDLWDGVTFSKPVPTAEDIVTLADNVRAERDKLLSATDFYALSDVVMTTAMTTYRQALRDVPTQSGFPSEVTWPDKPA